MLVGEPPYPGNTAQAVLGKIIQGLPVSATAVRKSVPVNVDAAMRKALETLPADRFTAVQDFAKALADPGFRHGEEAAAGVALGRGQWTGLAAATTGLAVVLVRGPRPRMVAPPAPSHCSPSRSLRAYAAGRPSTGDQWERRPGGVTRRIEGRIRRCLDRGRNAALAATPGPTLTHPDPRHGGCSKPVILP